MDIIPDYINHHVVKDLAMKPLLCIFGLHTGLTNSRYQFKGYDKITDHIAGLTGHGSIDAIYHTTCGNCGAKLKDQKFSVGWYPQSYRSLPHTLEEAMAKARALQSNK